MKFKEYQKVKVINKATHFYQCEGTICDYTLETGIRYRLWGGRASGVWFREDELEFLKNYTNPLLKWLKKRNEK